MKRLIMFILLVPSICSAGEFYLNHSQMAGEVSGHVTTVGIDDTADTIDFSAYYKYGETEGIVRRDEGSFSFGYDPQVSDRWHLWFDEVVGYNKVLGIRFENFAGGGLKYQAFNSLSLSGGALYYYRADDESAEGLYSFRLKFENDIAKAVYFYQPYIDDAGKKITKGRVEIRPFGSILFYHEFENRTVEDSAVSESGIKFVFKYGGKDV